MLLLILPNIVEELREVFTQFFKDGKSAHDFNLTNIWERKLHWTHQFKLRLSLFLPTMIFCFYSPHNHSDLW